MLVFRQLCHPPHHYHRHYHLLRGCCYRKNINLRCISHSVFVSDDKNSSTQVWLINSNLFFGSIYVYSQANNVIVADTGAEYFSILNHGHLYGSLRN